MFLALAILVGFGAYAPCGEASAADRERTVSPSCLRWI